MSVGDTAACRKKRELVYGLKGGLSVVPASTQTLVSAQVLSVRPKSPSMSWACCLASLSALQVARTVQA